MKLFIAGICGTFMAGIAQLAKAGGHQVRGCDAGVYPPMSDLLEAHGIEVLSGYRPEHLEQSLGRSGMVIIGNALSRGNPLVEHVLDAHIPFCSGPEWLRAHILAKRQVIGVAGTHGKTSTASMLAWILECAGFSPGYLIGGKPGNFAQSAAIGGGKHFVIEADEYDTAFFDKRAKFVHYRPDIAVLNNLEFDHADIYDDIAQIQKQFHHLVRTVPSGGCVVVNADDARLAEVLEMGCWSKVVRFSASAEPLAAESVAHGDDIEWRAVPTVADGSKFDVVYRTQTAAQVEWGCIGAHNVQNALAAVAAAAQLGVSAAVAGKYLGGYVPAERRLQVLFQSAHVVLYDDFAHHPTAIRHVIAAVRAKHPKARVIAVVELRSNTMRLSERGGGHGGALATAVAAADVALVCGGELARDADADAHAHKNDGGDGNGEHAAEIISCAHDKIIDTLKLKLSGNDIIITMSNGGFDGMPKKIAQVLATL